MTKFEWKPLPIGERIAKSTFMAKKIGFTNTLISLNTIHLITGMQTSRVVPSQQVMHQNENVVDITHKHRAEPSPVQTRTCEIVSFFSEVLIQSTSTHLDPIPVGKCMDVPFTDVSEKDCVNYDCDDTQISCPPKGQATCPGWDGVQNCDCLSPDDVYDTDPSCDKVVRTHVHPTTNKSLHIHEDTHTCAQLHAQTNYSRRHDQSRCCTPKSAPTHSFTPEPCLRPSPHSHRTHAYTHAHDHMHAYELTRTHHSWAARE